MLLVVQVAQQCSIEKIARKIQEELEVVDLLSTSTVRSIARTHSTGWLASIQLCHEKHLPIVEMTNPMADALPPNRSSLHCPRADA